MAAYEKGPSRGKGPSLQQGLGAPRAVIQAILSLAAKRRRTQWPPFPMGQRTRGTFKSASSYLLQQLIRRSQETETEAQGEEESSEESEESEMLNLEVCLIPLPSVSSPQPRSSSSCQTWLPQLQLASALLHPTHSGQAPLSQRRGLFFAAHFCSVSSVLHLLSGVGAGWGHRGLRGQKPSKYLLSFRGFLYVRLPTAIMKNYLCYLYGGYGVNAFKITPC